MARSKRRAADKIARSDASQQDGQPVSGGGLSTVAVDAAGALDGDGSVLTPLAVKVDGSSMIINGSNELESTGSAIGLHAATHENGGGDEINVGGLSGVLADPQPPIIGAGAAQAVAGNDARLTNARTPTAHAASHAAGGGDPVTLTEAQVTNLVTDLAAKAPAARVITAGAGLTGGGDLSADRTLDVGAGTGIQVNANDVEVKYGTVAGTAAQGNDARLSDARTPSAHHVSHEDGGTDEISVTGLSGVLADAQHPIIGAGATQAVAGNDARLTDTRTPTDNTVSTTKLVDLAVTTAKIANGAVTLSKLSPMTGVPTGRVIGIPDGAALGDPQALTFNQIMELVQASANGDIIIRSGGAWIRLPKGTDGQALTLVAGVPAWAGLTVGSPGSLDLTNAQIQSGNTTPIDIVAAPGAGKVIIPISCTHYTNVTVSKGANPTLRLRWNGDTTDLLGATNMQLNSTGEWLRTLAANLTAQSLSIATFDPRNKSLQWSLSANTAVGAATGKVRVAYTVVDLN